MSVLVGCRECGAVFVRDNAPSQCCPVCHFDGIRGDGIGGIRTKRAWHQEVEE